MKRTLLLLGFGLISNLAVAQISNETLKEMKKAGLSDDIIKTKILAEEVKFDVSTNALLDLKKAGFSDELISVMIQKNSADKLATENTEKAEDYSRAVYSIENKGEHLLVNGQYKIEKGGTIQIHLPSNKDFVFVKQKKSLFSTQLIGNIAGVVGTGAATVGIGTNSIGTWEKAIKVMNTANAVQYGANAINQIENLPISDKAKKIAGKQMKVKEWNFTDDGWVITAELDKKKYEIPLQYAVMVGEVKLK